MRYKMNGLIGACVLAWGTLALCLSVATAAPLPWVPTPPIPLTPGETAIVTRALGHPLDMEFHSRDEGINRGRLTLGLVGPSGSIGIDKATGLVVNFHLHSRLPRGITSPDPALNVDAAQAIAMAFLGRIGIPHVEGWTLKNKTLHVWGGKNSYFCFYTFEWVKLFHGVEMPAYVHIHVLADSGQIFNYILVDDPIVVPIQVNLTREDAIHIVAQSLHWAHPIIKKASLSIWYAGGYPEGPQTVMWRFEIGNPDALTGADSYVWADVNAATGEIIGLGRAAGFWRKPKPGTPEPTKVVLPQPDLKTIPKDAIPPTVFQLAARTQEEHKPGLSTR